MTIYRSTRKFEKCSENEIQLQRLLEHAPAFIRPPRPRERCPWTGKSRSSFLELIVPCERNGFKPPVKGIYQRSHKYATRGTWSVPAENLFRYLLSLQDQSVTDYIEAGRLRGGRA